MDSSRVVEKTNNGYSEFCFKERILFFALLSYHLRINKLDLKVKGKKKKQ